MSRYIRAESSDRIPDCGCGPGDLLEYLPRVEYIGIDMDARYLAEARRRFGDRAAFVLGSLGPSPMSETAHYDLVLAIGVLHHLDDVQGRSFMSLARRSLNPTGRLVTLEPCYTDTISHASRAFFSIWIVAVTCAG